MAFDEELIPPPRLVRVRLAMNIRERQLLRSLLRLAERHAEDKEDIQAIHRQDDPRTPPGPGVAR